MKPATCLAAFLTVLASSAAGAAALVDRPWTHYNDLLDLVKMDRFYAAPAAQRDKVVMQGVITPNDPAIARKDVIFTIVDGSERKRIQVGADGGFVVPFNQDWVKTNPEVLTTIPAGQKAKFAFRVLPVMPKKTQLDYVSVMGGVPQVNALIKSQAGMMRFLMPTIVGVTLQFPKASHATVSINGGGAARVLAADANGVVKLPLEQALLAANVPVTLSELPDSVDFIED